MSAARCDGAPRRCLARRALFIPSLFVTILVAASCAPGLGAADGAFPDGTGHRTFTEPPGALTRSVCPEYRENNPGQTYDWDRLAFRSELEAELAHCSRVLPDSLGGWVVEERSDEDGSYSIAAFLPAASHAVTFDWGGFEPTLWLTCWRSWGYVEDEHEGDGTAGDTAEDGLLVAALWHFGPPQFLYGEPTPVRYQFREESEGQTALWQGHPGQAEVARLPPPDSHRLAGDMRRAAGKLDSEDSGPVLIVETWEGESLNTLSASQGRIEFNLLGLERAAFPVFDACGVVS